MKLTGGLPAPSSAVLVSAFRRRRLQKQGENDQIPAQKRAHRATPETEMLFFNTQQSTSEPAVPSALLLNSRQRLKEAVVKPTSPGHMLRKAALGWSGGLGRRERGSKGEERGRQGFCVIRG